MGLIFTKGAVTTAVLLCGGHHEDLNPLLRDTPVCTLPVLNRHLIEYTVDFLRNKGIRNVLVSIPKDDGFDTAEYMENLSHSFRGRLEISHFEEDKHIGTAGSLRAMRDHVGDESFLVIASNIYMGNIDLERFMAEHAESKASLTVGVLKNRKYPTEDIYVDKNGSVEGFSVIHPSRDRRSPYTPLGVYIADPSVFGFIKEKGYFDIKEQLIPALKKASLHVQSHEIEGYCRPIETIEDYFGLHREVLLTGNFTKAGLTEISDGVWAGENISISPKAYMAGPVLIGRNCTISDDVQIIGPAVIGDNCTVGKRARIRESIMLSDFDMDDNASVKYCVVGRGVKIFSGDSFSNKILVDNLKVADVNLIPSRYEFNGVIESMGLKMGGYKYAAFLGLKRLLDIAVSLACLIIFSPVMLALALAVKLDSDGPAVFRQKRCGKDGVDFEMLKFRTMVKDAHAQQKKLSDQKNVDGPMFKLLNDPRITRIGQFLRKTSLDELPQLLNVLKGEMSLVGPRPLVMDEMKFSQSWRSIRLKVKPGITGLWQVQGRSEASFHDWIRHDVYYVQNQSFWLDVKILLKTVGVVFRKGGAY
ncbi:MAG: exopolysaccharide biosynthesis polyprenyl glycosylphosphotransferase [Deltaproteobacteria bacterium]|nr:exopolysaccharide biosynthesis polyprenyl glycosylphosphotransferase [Deltaproteobacteria bacterium]